MKALVKIRREPGAVELKEVEVPKVRPTEVLVKVKAAAICGTDLHIYEWSPWAAKTYSKHIPLIFGHEFSGQVVDVGNEVKTLQFGDRVTAETRTSCGHCFHCLTGLAHLCPNGRAIAVDINGAFAEYVSVPADCTFELPPKVSYKEGAAFEPLGAAVSAVEKAQLSPGDICAVLGCGPIGLFIIQVAKVSGGLMVVATDLSEYRLELASKVGADLVSNPKDETLPEKIKELTGNKGGFDVVFEASGSPSAMKQGLNILRRGGKMIVMGIQPKPVEIDISKNVIFKMLTLIGTLGRNVWSTWMRTATLVSTGRVNIKSVLTHELPLSEFQRGFELLGQQKASKILLIP